MHSVNVDRMRFWSIHYYVNLGPTCNTFDVSSYATQNNKQTVGRGLTSRVSLSIKVKVLVIPKMKFPSRSKKLKTRKWWGKLLPIRCT